MKDEPLLPDIFSHAIHDDEFVADVLLDEDEGELVEEKGVLIDYPLDPEVYVKDKDAHGHMHKGKGPGGGQFTSGGDLGGGATDKKKSKDKKKGEARGKGKDKDKPQDRKQALAKLRTDAKKVEPEARKEYHATNHTSVLQSIRKRFTDSKGNRIGLLDNKSVPGFAAGSETPRPSIEKPGAYISRNQYAVLKQRAMSKMMGMVPEQMPTQEEIDDNASRIKEMGANEARKTLNGNNNDRRERKIALVEEFGDGEKCGCVYCGLVISFSPEFAEKSMEEDKIIDTRQGGRYRMYNLLPACYHCNRSRGDKDAVDYLTESTYAQEHKEQK